MNSEFVTDDPSVVKALLAAAIESSNEVPTSISLSQKDGRYVCEVSHPSELEPPPDLSPS